MKITWLVIAIAFVFGQFISAQNPTETAQQIPVIQFENVPLMAAIENLGQQAEFNFTIDPKIAATGIATAATPITIRWENLTAKQALARVLKERGLFLVENPQTGVAKITVTNSSPRVFTKEFMESSTNVIAMIRMSDAPLEEALANFGGKAGLKFQLDPKLSDSSKPFSDQIFVSVRFSNLTACQAVAAICDQHNLEIAKSEKAGVWTVSPGK
jgi:hypothetical protein